MTSASALKVICLTVQGIPLLVAAQQGLTLSPQALLVIAVLNLAAGLTLSELAPTLRGRNPIADALNEMSADELAEVKAMVDKAHGAKG